ncbi:unnamed protein product [Heterobilharzia americana]|nr:unnamed protein product [Heterobilharzia americana]
MVFETRDVLMYMSDMQRNLASFRSTNSPLSEVFNSNTKSTKYQADNSLDILCKTINRVSDSSKIVEVSNNQVNQQLCTTINEYSSLPENLKLIVSKALEASYQENTENITPDVKRLLYKPLNMRTDVCTCKVNDPSTSGQQSSLIPSCATTSPDSGLGYEQLGIPGRNARLTRTTHQSIKLNPRPLLRQKESIPLNASFPLTSDISLTDVVKMTTSQSEQQISTISTNTTSHRPMQVHMRYPVPRKQDAIYNARYKTQPCLHYQKYKHCPLGDNCHFAHGPEELKYPQFHPKYRTRVCINYAKTGNCPFGKNCYFLHSLTHSSTSTSLSTQQQTGNYNGKGQLITSSTVKQREVIVAAN